MLQLCIWQILTQANEEIEQKVVRTKLQYKEHHLLDFPPAYTNNKRYILEDIPTQ
jgi:succinylglutamate desuccinylase